MIDKGKRLRKEGVWLLKQEKAKRIIFRSRPNRSFEFGFV